MTLLELGAAANAERERRHGDRVYFSLQPLAVHTLTCAAAELEARLTALPPGTTALAIRLEGADGATLGEAEIRAVAQARLAAPGVEHIAADWTTLTPYVAQVALRFGADTLIGIPPGTSRQEVVRLITEAGRQPLECNAAYQPHQAAWESPLPVLHS